MSLTPDPCQQAALELMQSGASVFLTGNAGTGKSTVLTTFLGESFRSVDITASTGVAALNLRDQFHARSGLRVQVSTVYRWAGINLGPEPDESFDDCFSRLDHKPPRSRLAAWQRVCRAVCLIIDEISMLPGRTFAYLEWHCRKLRRCEEPWGGLQVIASGDFLQLPPVSKNGLYDWAFLSPAWKKTCFRSIALKTIHRQADPVFTGLLNAARTGRLTEQHMHILRKRIAVFPDQKLLRLMTHNTQVDAWNRARLDDLEGKSTTFIMWKEGPQNEVEFLVNNLLTPEVLTLKKRARVMVTANLMDERHMLRAVNGSLGTVTEWTSHGVAVLLDDGRTLCLEPYTWHIDPNHPDHGGVTQIPLRLAWAATIHKSQGLSLPSALIDVRATREPGQTYVALSRVRSLEGLWLRDLFAGVWVSPEAMRFMNTLA